MKFPAAALILFTAVAQVPDPAAPKNVHVVRFLSESLGAERPFSILLPVDYETAARRYPVLYLLHGNNGNHTNWWSQTNLSAYAAERELIIVMPDVGRSRYINHATDAKARFEDHVIKDLIDYVDTHFRTIPLRRARAVAGLSMGGYGAALYGLKHYRLFTAFGAFSGSVAIATDHPAMSGTPPPAAIKQAKQDLLEAFGAFGSAARAERDLFQLVEKVPASEMPGIYIACGAQDFLVDNNREFARRLASKNIAFEYHEVSPRTHTWDFWDEQIPVFLDWLARRPDWPR